MKLVSLVHWNWQPAQTGGHRVTCARVVALWECGGQTLWYLQRSSLPVGSYIFVQFSPLEYAWGLWLASNQKNRAKAMGCYSCGYFNIYNYKHIDMYIFYFLYCWLWRSKLLYCYLPVERAPCQGTAGSLYMLRPQSYNHKELNPGNNHVSFQRRSWVSDEITALWGLTNVFLLQMT